jgi:hypothetical protein
MDAGAEVGTVTACIEILVGFWIDRLAIMNSRRASRSTAARLAASCDALSGMPRGGVVRTGDGHRMKFRIAR